MTSWGWRNRLISQMSTEPKLTKTGVIFRDPCQVGVAAENLALPEEIRLVGAGRCSPHLASGAPGHRKPTLCNVRGNHHRGHRVDASVGSVQDCVVVMVELSSQWSGTASSTEEAVRLGGLCGQPGQSVDGVRLGIWLSFAHGLYSSGWRRRRTSSPSGSPKTARS